MTTMLSTSAGLRGGSTGFHYKRISWAAIFAGTLVALGIQLLLSLLGIGIGMGAIDPLRDRNPGAGMGTGTLIWWVMTFLAALFIGGWVSGKLSRTMNRFESIMHGVLVWIIFVLLNFYLLTSIAGSVMSAAGGADGIRSQAPATETQARKTAEDTAAALSKAGIAAFVGLLLGAIVAGIGANIGRGDDFRVEYDPLTAGSPYVPAR